MPKARKVTKEIVVIVGYNKFVVKNITAAQKIISGFNGAIRVECNFDDDDADYVHSEKPTYRDSDVKVEMNVRVADRNNLLGLPAPKDT